MFSQKRTETKEEKNNNNNTAPVNCEHEQSIEINCVIGKFNEICVFEDCKLQIIDRISVRKHKKTIKKISFFKQKLFAYKHTHTHTFANAHVHTYPHAQIVHTATAETKIFIYMNLPTKKNCDVTEITRNNRIYRQYMALLE